MPMSLTRLLRQMSTLGLLGELPFTGSCKVVVTSEAVRFLCVDGCNFHRQQHVFFYFHLV